MNIPLILSIGALTGAVATFIVIVALVNALEKQRELSQHHYNLFASREADLVEIQALAYFAITGNRAPGRQAPELRRSVIAEIHRIATSRWERETTPR